MLIDIVRVDRLGTHDEKMTDANNFWNTEQLNIFTVYI